MSRTREVEVYSAITKLDPSAPYFVQSRTLVKVAPLISAPVKSLRFNVALDRFVHCNSLFACRKTSWSRSVFRSLGLTARAQLKCALRSNVPIKDARVRSDPVKSTDLRSMRSKTAYVKFRPRRVREVRPRISSRVQPRVVSQSIRDRKLAEILARPGGRHT